MSDDHAAPALDPDDLDISRSEYVRELGEDRYVVSAGGGPPRAPRSGEPDEQRDATEDRTPERSGEQRTRSVAEEAEARVDVAPSDPKQGGGNEPGNRPESGSARSEPGGTGGATDADAGSPTSPPKRAAEPRRGVKRGAPTGRNAGSETDPAPGTGTKTGGDVDAAAVGRWLAESLSDTEYAYGFDATVTMNDEATRHRMVSNDVSAVFETLALWFARSAGGDDMPPERALAILLAEMEAEVTLPTVALEDAVARHGLSAEDSIGDLLAAAERENGLTLE
ncbi:DUF7500 family protein [Halorarum halobium]|uniref:DUF7500 family protein n=1 Tax=Halorarum halobium TaxID=3075121 RepID=UPI0028AA1CA7|nr:hypothetical protein [Halobaculum sp. XH14]